MSKLIDRAKAILLTPRTEWPVIAAEPATTAGLYKNYIAILAALGPFAMFLSLSVIGVGTFLGSFRIG
ncbi:MAG: Yip1 family protein, partial [Steroidobacteraceae bacterium]